jgi:flagellum-specific peptidoglycan hydrolase FlgJ
MKNAATPQLTPNQRAAFIAAIAPAAQASQRKWNVPASITIAQAILESGWGQSRLSISANNFFGIKYGPRSDEGYVAFPTKEYVNGIPETQIARFDKFISAEEAFDAHGELLATAQRYARAMADAGDPFVFAARLQDCGYSTDPNYAAKVCRLITDYRLTEYDAPPSAPAAAARAANG